MIRVRVQIGEPASIAVDDFLRHRSPRQIRPAARSADQ
jgi:hypothetical protein